MKYIEICIDVSEEGIEAVIGQLLNLGITDTVVEDPRDIQDLMDKKQTYDWDYLEDSIIEKMQETPKVKVYLEDTQPNRALADRIMPAMEELKVAASSGVFGSNVDFGTLRVTRSEDDDAKWKDRWKEYFKPSRISQRIVVKPTWEPYERKADDLVIEIDPGMAFGTGTHETTSLCIRMLERYLKEDYCVLDVGCGSGILSVAAAMLGAGEVLGVEIDPVAVQVARENVDLNDVGAKVSVQQGDLTSGLDFTADLVVANLMADLVMILSEDVARHMNSGGLFISSGILTEKEEAVASHLKQHGFDIVEIAEDGQWCCIVASSSI